MRYFVGVDKVKNDPAFPIQSVDPRNRPDEPCYGITKREYFAAMAMQGIISNPSVDVLTCGQIANDAFMYADAMLAESEKRDSDK